MSRPKGWTCKPPELGRLQILAAALQVRFRIEVAGQHFDDAVRTAKTMLALARHLGDYPAETANLLGLIVAESAFGTLEEMVQQPACPNLYWALTDLPCPLVEVRKGFQGDCALAATELREIRDRRAYDRRPVATFREQSVGQDWFRSRAGGPAAPESASRTDCACQRSRDGSGPRAADWSRPVLRRSCSRSSQTCRSCCWTRNRNTRSSGTKR